MENATTHPPRVLLVDDDPAFHRLIESVLTPAGIPFVSLRTGEQALAFCEVEKPSLVIIDGLLPGIRGDEVSAKLRWKWPKEELYILFVSAFFRDVKSRARLTQTVGVDSILFKPVSPERLRRALANVPGLESHTNPEAVPELQLSMAVELLRDYLVLSDEAMLHIREALGELGGKRAEIGLSKLRNAVHKFAGTGTSFGLPEVSRVSKQLELWLDAHPTLPMADATIARIVGLVEALEVRLRHAKESQDVVPAVTTRQLQVVLIDGPGDLALSSGEAAGTGAPLRMFAEAESALEAVKERPADIYFVAADRSNIDGFAVARQWHELNLGPVVLLGKDESLTARLQAQASHAKGYIPRVADSSALFELANQFAGLPDGLVGVILGSDSKRMGEISETLQSDGLSMVPVVSVPELLSMLTHVDPALIVIATPMAVLGPKVDAPSVLRMLRNDHKTHETPMVMWLENDDFALRTEALRAGADAVVSSRAGLEDLQWQVKALMRSRASHFRHQQLPQRSLMLSRAAFMTELDVALGLAKRGRALSLAAFEVEPEFSVRWSDGYERESYLSAIAHTIRRGFRTSDLMSTLAMGRFALMLYDADKANALKLVEAVVSKIHAPENSERLGHVKIRAAVVTFPDFNSDAEGMLEHALELIETNKAL